MLNCFFYSCTIFHKVYWTYVTRYFCDQYVFTFCIILHTFKIMIYLSDMLFEQVLHKNPQFSN